VTRVGASSTIALVILPVSTVRIVRVRLLRFTDVVALPLILLLRGPWLDPCTLVVRRSSTMVLWVVRMRGHGWCRMDVRMNRVVRRRDRIWIVLRCSIYVSHQIDTSEVVFTTSEQPEQRSRKPDRHCTDRYVRQAEETAPDHGWGESMLKLTAARIDSARAPAGRILTYSPSSTGRTVAAKSDARRSLLALQLPVLRCSPCSSSSKLLCGRFRAVGEVE
jgi:hypothetical protein